MHARGYLLLELAIVFVLIIVGGFLLIGFADKLRARALVRQEVEFLYATCVLLKARARFDGHCDEQRSGFYIDGAWHVFPKFVNYGAGGVLGAVLGPPATPTHALEHFVSFPHHELLFYSDGSMNAGVVYMGSAYAKILYAISSSVSDPFFLRLYRYTKGSWSLIDGLEKSGA